ncbi:hypothetical protein [Paraburkholderia graminis]|uniref:hypothetical protein n=1 Tax=Paraburkholderia graminis TaxID=60548 RepID=UPI00137B3CA8|nr:hypothetical protein [Paraburkholderia graminis]
MKNASMQSAASELVIRLPGDETEHAALIVSAHGATRHPACKGPFAMVMHLSTS